MTPPDISCCQAEKPNGVNFMTFGGRPKLERCRDVPTMIVVEMKRADDGTRGAMGLCDDCYKVMQEQMPEYEVVVFRRES